MESRHLLQMWNHLCRLSLILFVVNGVDADMNSTDAAISTGTPVTATPHEQMHFWSNFEMMQRAFYVLIGISVLTVLYFVIRSFSLKKKPQRKKYGLLSDYDENMEMGSMDSDEDKIFESRNIRR